MGQGHPNIEGTALTWFMRSPRTATIRPERTHMPTVAPRKVPDHGVLLLDVPVFFSITPLTLLGITGSCCQLQRQSLEKMTSNTLSASAKQYWRSYLWLLPAVAGTTWLIMLTTLLAYWLAAGRPRLPMQSNPYIA